MNNLNKFLFSKVLALSILFNVSYAQDYSFAIDQIQELPPFMSGFMKEYMRDFNENINNSFFFAAQSSSEVISKGSWELSLLAGSSILFPGEINNYQVSDFSSNGRIFFNGGVPSIFGRSSSPSIVFQFEDPNSNLPLLNPFTGETVELEFDSPSGLGLGIGATPSAALSLGYGLGIGTELKVYATPMFLSALGTNEEGIEFTRDLAWGAQIKHEITHWIPGMYDRGWHIALAGGYSSYQLDISTSFLSNPFSSNLTDSISIGVSDNLEGASYEVTTYGGRVLVGKTFRFGEFNLSVDYASNSYSMTSQGNMQVELVDATGNTPNLNSTLKGFMDFEGDNSTLGYGAALTLGRGWFRTSLSYRRANVSFAAIGLQFHFRKKKEESPSPTPSSDQ